MTDILSSYQLPRFGTEDEQQRVYLNKILRNVHDVISSSPTVPVTTKGDIFGFSTVPARVPVGSDGKVLTADSTNPLGVSWQTPASGSSPLTTKGDLFGHSTVDARLPVGSNGQSLIADSSQAIGLKYATIVSEGAYGSRPAAGIAGLVYVANDLPILSIDNGSSWDEYRNGWKAKALDTEILADSPTSYYKVNEQSGTTITDYGSAAHNATLSSGFTLAVGALVPTETTLYGGSSGANANVTVSANPTGTSTPTGDWSVVVLARQTTGSGGSLFSFYDASASGSYFFLSEIINNVFKMQVMSNTQSPPFDANVPNGKVCLLHAVHDATAHTTDFYVNGVHCGAATSTTEYNLTIATPTLKIANDRGGTGYTGFVAHCGFWYGTKLTSARIQAHAQAAGLYCL